MNNEWYNRWKGVKVGDIVFAKRGGIHRVTAILPTMHPSLTPDFEYTPLFFENMQPVKVVKKARTYRCWGAWIGPCRREDLEAARDRYDVAIQTLFGSLPSVTPTSLDYDPEDVEGENDVE
jgi:hypothetical protein